jgi:PHD/YefM family antitoxin component YafN of YafNO toxin-antitoxin module
VNDDRIAAQIISKNGLAYHVAADDYESTEETDYLLHSLANAALLPAAAERRPPGSEPADQNHGRT